MARKLDRRQALKGGLVVAGGAAFAPAALEALTTLGERGAQAAGITPWPEADLILNCIQLPQIPQGLVVNVMDHGAVADGHTDCTSAFAAAITACNAAGGGQVLVPAGTYSSSSIYIKSKVDFHLAAGARINFNSTPPSQKVLSRHEGIECLNYMPHLYAFQESDIAITGSGTFDASGASWNSGNNTAGVLGPLVTKFPNDPLSRDVAGQLAVAYWEPYECSRVLIQGVTLAGPRFWQLHPTRSNNVTVDGVKETPNSTSHTDGFDPECCDIVVLKNTALHAHDDAIAIKSGRDADGRRVNIPCTNIVIMNNTFDTNWGAITCGSEQSGGIANVYAFNNTISTSRYMFYVKDNSARGGIGTLNINIDSFTGAASAMFNVLNNYGGQSGPYPVVFKDWTITNCHTTGGGLGSLGSVTNLYIHNSTAGGASVDRGTPFTPTVVHPPQCGGGPPPPTPTPTPGPSSPPSNAAGVSAMSGQISGTWTPPTDQGGGTVSAYAVWLWSNASQSGQFVMTSGPSFTTSGLQSGGAYIFIVTAYNGNGWSNWSGWSNWVLVL